MPNNFKFFSFRPSISVLSVSGSNFASSTRFFILLMMLFSASTLVISGAQAASTSVPKMAKPSILPDEINLTTHQAVYEMGMLRADRNSGISNIEGRMVFDFSGSRCEGYTLNMRMATNVTDKQGDAMLSDLRSSTWEHGKGDRFRFHSSQYYNHTLSEVTTGDAKHTIKHDRIMVRLRKPDRENLGFANNILFPSQHTRFLIKSALSSKKFVEAKLYDGSEKGKKVFYTTAFIGKVSDPFKEEILPGKGADAEIDQKLAGLRSWPVALSYFDKEKVEGEENLPSYELFFTMYENGVSRNLLIDYGDFALKGKLTNLKVSSTNRCNK